MRISDWSSDVCSSDLQLAEIQQGQHALMEDQSGKESSDKCAKPDHRPTPRNLATDATVSELRAIPAAAIASSPAQQIVMREHRDHRADRKSTRLNSSQ